MADMKWRTEEGIDIHVVRRGPHLAGIFITDPRSGMGVSFTLLHDTDRATLAEALLAEAVPDAVKEDGHNA